MKNITFLLLIIISFCAQKKSFSQNYHFHGSLENDFDQYVSYDIQVFNSSPILNLVFDTAIYMIGPSDFSFYKNLNLNSGSFCMIYFNNCYGVKKWKKVLIDTNSFDIEFFDYYCNEIICPSQMLPHVTSKDEFNRTTASTFIYYKTNTSSYTYNFGDGYILTTDSNYVEHQYNTTGLFTVSYTLSDSANGCFLSDSVYFLSENLTPYCFADFLSIWPLSKYLSLDNQSTFYSPSTTYSIDFGDGSSSTVDYRGYIEHQYDTAGLYLVKLTMSDTGCFSERSEYIEIGVKDSTCSSYFVGQCSYFNQVGYLYYPSVSYINENLFTNYKWDFGNGNFAFEKYSLLFYENPGVYDIKLIMEDSICTDTFNYTFNTNTCVNYFDDYYCYTDIYLYSNSGANIVLVNNSLPGNYEYQWDFGDGSTSNLQYPSHTYTQTGSFTVCLKMVDLDSACTDFSCIDLQIDSLYRSGGVTLQVISPNELLSINQNKNEKSTFIIHPNPNNGTFRIRNEANKSFNQIKIFDMMGKLIQTIHSNEAINNEIRLNHPKPGLYFLQIELSEKTETIKVVIQ